MQRSGTRGQHSRGQNVSATGAKLAAERMHEALPKAGNPLAHLLHALNQPLTGLQCSLELAASGPRPADHIRTLREGLELTGRMRILVEAMRELVDIQPPDGESAEPFLLDELLRDTANDLLPVAEAKSVELLLVSSAPLPVEADRRQLATLIFRLLDSTLSLAREKSRLLIVTAPEPQRARIVVSWNPGPLPEHSPFSRQELGLLIAQAGWEQAGAEWSHTRAEMTHTCTVRLPLASPFTARSPC